MKFKLGLMLLLFVLLTSTTVLAAEKALPIPGLGAFTFPEDVEILAAKQIDNNFPSNTLWANDNGTWRSITILFAPTRNIDVEAFKHTKKLESAFDELLTKITKDHNAKLLYSSPINKSVINNAQLAFKSFKFLDAEKVVYLKLYIVQGINKSVGIVTVCFDNDNEYWNPRVAKMIADIKR